MEITVIHGQGHKGSTYNISKMMYEKLSEKDTILHEFFMPKDTPQYCVGCFKCIYEGAQKCPHANKVQTIVAAMEKSDIIIVDSPTYCMEMTGQLKTFFDHLAYMWLPHRPNKTMFTKVGIVVSTAAGSGSKRVAKSLAKQLSWLGTAKIYKIAKNVRASSWNGVSDKTKLELEAFVDKRATKIKDKLLKPVPNIKSRLLFKFMSGMQKNNTFNKTDKEHWEKNGWLNKSVPWR